MNMDPRHAHDHPQPPASRTARTSTCARRPLRVLHLIETLSRGGAERNLTNMLRALPASEHAVLHLTGPDEHAAALREHGVAVRCLGMRGPLDLGRVLYEITDELLRGDYHLLMTQIMSADVIGRIAGMAARVPVISMVQTAAYEEQLLALYTWKGRMKTRAQRVLDSLSARLSGCRIIAVSEFVAEQTVARLGVPAGRVALVPNSVDLSEFAPATMEQRLRCRAGLGLGAEARVLITVGKLNRGKGIDLLVDAMPAVLREEGRACLLVLGDGPERGALERAISRADLSRAVLLPGLVADVRSHLHAADAFVFPSRLEGLPLSVLEAMATGLPCALSDIPPHREIARGEAALLVPQDARAWSDAMLRILTDGDLAADLGARGLLTVRSRFSAEVVAAALERVLEDTAASRPPRVSRASGY